MKALHDAIRDGARKTSPGTGFHSGGACALQAALVGVGRDPARFGRINRIWPELMEPAVHPISGRRDRLEAIIWILNDVTGWSRECIADWIELGRIGSTSRQRYDRWRAAFDRLPPYESRHHRGATRQTPELQTERPGRQQEVSQ